MTNKTIFFYGLFMDPDVLQNQNCQSSTAIIAKLRNYELHLGARATLKPSEGDNVYGTLMRLSQSSLDELYSAPSVQDYQATPVTCQLAEDDFVEAITYILPNDYPLAPPPNADYARRLLEVCNKMNIPSPYQQKLADLIKAIENRSKV